MVTTEQVSLGGNSSDYVSVEGVPGTSLVNQRLTILSHVERSKDSGVRVRRVKGNFILYTVRSGSYHYATREEGDRGFPFCSFMC